MKQKKKRLISVFLFFLLAALMLAGLNQLLKPKWSSDYRSGSNIRGFYTMPKDSIDVLIVGSSNVICGVNANTMFCKAGISAWSCGTEAQPVFGSLAWIREAARFHDLSAVVLDLGSLFDSFDEVNYRKALDYMRLSPLKLQLLKEYHAQQPEISLSSYLFPLIQYHSRWSELSSEDFSIDSDYLRGFLIRTEKRGSAISGIDLSNPSIKEIPENNWNSLMKIISFCRENKIVLLFVNCPSARITAAEHNAIAAIAEDYQIPFLDFNDVSLWSSIDYSEDMADFQHLNVDGADKASVYILTALQEICALPDRSADSLQQKLAAEYADALSK